MSWNPNKPPEQVRRQDPGQQDPLPIHIPPPDKPQAAYIPTPIKVFYCYAREDKILRDKLERHLGSLKRTKQITTWHDREIQPGTEWEREIDSHIESANLILLLISADFIDSDYCWGKEMSKALDKHKEGTAHVIPIVLRPVVWAGTPIAELQLLPTDAKPITQWADPDLALENIAQNISQIVNYLQEKAAEAHKRQEELSLLKHEIEYLDRTHRALNAQTNKLTYRTDKLTALKEELNKQLNEIQSQIQSTENEVNANYEIQRSIHIQMRQIEKEHWQRLNSYNHQSGQKPFPKIGTLPPIRGIPRNAITPGTLPKITDL